MAVTDEEFKQLKDAVSDLTSHLVAVLDHVDEALAAVSESQAGTSAFPTARAAIQRTKSHIVDVRMRMQES